MIEDKDNDINRVIAEADDGDVVAIIGDVDTGKFSLLPLSHAPVEGLLGVVGVVKGRLDAAFTCGIPEPMLEAIRQESYRLIKVGLRILERAGSMPVN
ncbi:MAG: hypothetical protein WB993_09425 [Candidatus Sulfotelmatobacter sp.]